jgi:hypothetical protein
LLLLAALGTISFGTPARELPLLALQLLDAPLNQKIKTLPGVSAA